MKPNREKIENRRTKKRKWAAIDRMQDTHDLLSQLNFEAGISADPLEQYECTAREFQIAIRKFELMIDEMRINGERK